MSKFFVGQRVKKVRGPTGNGATGVVSLDQVSPLNQIDGCDMTVKLDRSQELPGGRIVKAGTVVATFSDCWEPITPDGHRPAELTVEELLPFLKEQASA